MPTIVVLPKMGMTMTEGTLAQWLVRDGARVLWASTALWPRG